MKSEGRRIIKLQPPKIIRTIVFLALPTFLIGLLLIGTTYWHIPTDMQVKFRARSLTFKVGGSELQSLVDGASFQALMVRKFSRMTFPIPVSLDALDKTLEPERIIPLPLPSHDFLTIDGRSDPMIPSSVTFESPPSNPSSSIFGTLEALRIPAGSEVTLNLAADQITKPAIRIKGTQTSVTILLKETFRLSAENCELPPELQPDVDQQAVTFQLRLPASDPRIDISPQPGIIEFALTVARGSTANMFSKTAIPVTWLNFNPHPIRYTEISYPGIKKIITETGIDPVELKDLEGFVIQNLRLNSIDNVSMLDYAVTGLEFQLNGIVRDHATGSFGTSRDYRLTVFDKIWRNPAMIILLVILVWGSSTFAGGYLLYKDSIVSLKKQVIEFQTQSEKLRIKNAELQAHILEQQRNLDLLAPTRKNPYVVGSPILERSLFVGREKIIRQIQQGIHNNHFYILGSPRSGKTSLLKRLAEKVDSFARPDYDFQVIEMDLQSITDKTLFTSLCQEFLKSASQFIEKYNLSGIDEHMVTEYTSRAKTTTTGDDFVDLFLAVSETIIQAHGKRVIFVVLFDEFDKINTFELAIKEQFRSIFMQTVDNLRLVAAGGELDIWDRSSPFNFMIQIDLPPLTEEEARRLIVEPSKGIVIWDEKVLDEMILRTQGNPFELQKLCKNLVDYAVKNRIFEINQAVLQDLSDQPQSKKVIHARSPESL